MKRNTKLLLLACLTLILLTCSGVTALILYSLSKNNFALLGIDTDSPTTAQIESVGRFRLPPSTANLSAHLEGFQDRALWIRFTIAPADEPALWTSSLCNAAPSQENAAPEMQDFPRPWWTPASAKTNTRRQATGPGVAQTILIDKSNPAQFTVYIETLEF